MTIDSVAPDAAAARGHRVVVFTGDLSYAVRKGIVEIDRLRPGMSWLVLVQRPRKRVAELLRSQWRNLKRNGWRWIPYQGADAWRRLRPAAPPAEPAPGAPGAEFAPEALAAHHGIRIEQVEDLHDAAVRRRVDAFAPSIGLALAAPILRRELFAIPSHGTLNLHKGRVPEYRGMPPAFWELCNDEAHIGCTVHWIDDRLDTGAVAATDRIEREPHATLRGLQLRLDEVGVALMGRSVAGVIDGTLHATPQPGGGCTWRKPTLAQRAALERRLAARQLRAEPRPKTWVKAAAGAASLAAWRSGLYRVATPRITVLLYHRVTDAVRDNLSVGIEQFDRQMALLRRYCRVLALDEVLASGDVPRSRAPLVCVTFDDGYLDNYLHAAPILQRHRIPAAFFVATGLVGSDRAFPHDVRRGNAPIPTMDWSQLRSMKAQGFTIGSHTVNHIDCAGEAEATVWRELVQSRDDLRRELSVDAVVLGYPYGGRHHMTPQRLELVRRAGYAGCLSAHGGSNVGRVDPFDVKRRGIHWTFNDQAFMRECVGIP